MNRWLIILWVFIPLFLLIVLGIAIFIFRRRLRQWRASRLEASIESGAARCRGVEPFSPVKTLEHTASVSTNEFGTDNSAGSQSKLYIVSPRPLYSDPSCTIASYTIEPQEVHVAHCEGEWCLVYLSDGRAGWVQLKGEEVMGLTRVTTHIWVENACEGFVDSSPLNCCTEADEPTAGPSVAPALVEYPIQSTGDSDKAWVGMGHSQPRSTMVTPSRGGGSTLWLATTAAPHYPASPATLGSGIPSTPVSHSPYVNAIMPLAAGHPMTGTPAPGRSGSLVATPASLHPHGGVCVGIGSGAHPIPPLRLHLLPKPQPEDMAVPIHVNANSPLTSSADSDSMSTANDAYSSDDMSSSTAVSNAMATSPLVGTNKDSKVRTAGGSAHKPSRAIASTPILGSPAAPSATSPSVGAGFGTLTLNLPPDTRSSNASRLGPPLARARFSATPTPREGAIMPSPASHASQLRT